MEEWRYSSTSVLNGGEWSPSRPGLFSTGKDRRLGKPQSWYEYCGEEKNLLPLPEI
jgi:hypothetical protein